MAPNNTFIEQSANKLMLKSKKIWLLSTLFCILLMVVIGGYTRLSDSGLSITEWRPITGTLPPLNEEQWSAEWNKYRASPEFQKINSAISFAYFKEIYLVEYLHRLFGRITGLVFLLPAIYFLINKALSKKETIFACVTTALFAMQGLVGWIMVASGLVDKPFVNHYKLAMHLSMALILFCYILWHYSHSYIQKIRHTNINKSAVIFIFILTFVQIVWGAFVAGLDAGLVYNTFPLMNGSIYPQEALTIKPYIMNFLDNHAWVQFTHRMLAYALYIVISLFYIFKLRKHNETSLIGFIIFILLNIQLVLGIATILSQVQISLAILHQINAVFLLASIAILMHKITHRELTTGEIK